MGKRSRHKQQQQTTTQPQQKEPVMSNRPIKNIKQMNGTMRCEFEHQVTSTTAKFEWTGPKLNAIWPQILAFFRWTNDTYHSESQVRLYVNVREKKWAAWAFPQKARTGMSATELGDTPEFAEQRKQFPDPDWYYWGTVHHHCNASAFQSGTDTANEQNQDGIHFTVGNLNSNLFDIHGRMYIGGYLLEKQFHYCDFWDIGNPLATFPDQMKLMLKSDWMETLAKLQMGFPPPKDLAFPEIWKENIIDVTPKVTITPTVYSSHSDYSYGCVPFYRRNYIERSKPNMESDLKNAMQMLDGLVLNPEFKIASVRAALNIIEQVVTILDDETLCLIDVLFKNDVLPDNFLSYAHRVVANRNAEKLRLAKGNGGEQRQLPLGSGPSGESFDGPSASDVERFHQQQMGDGLNHQHIIS